MSTMSFDRIADIYDDTRGHPPGIADQIAASIIPILPSTTSILNIGIGTGRISKPLLTRGVHITGIDISSKMMRQLLNKLPPGASVPDLAQADAAWLPFAPGVFQTVLAIHIFHLVPDWHRALTEITRVLQPGGILLAGYDWRSPDSIMGRIRDQWNKITLTCVPDADHPDHQEFENIKRTLQASGAEVDEWDAITWQVAFCPEQHIQQLEAGAFSSSWKVPPHFLPQCIAELRQWARQEFGPLDREHTFSRKFIWQRFQWKNKLK